MKVLVDVSVIFHYLEDLDEKCVRDSNLVMNMCADKKIDGYMAFHTPSIIWDTFGIMKMPEETSREFIGQICEILTTASAEQDAIIEAVHNTKFPDFEDNL